MLLRMSENTRKGHRGARALGLSGVAILSLAWAVMVGCRGERPSQNLGSFGVCAEPTADLQVQLDAIGDVWYYDYHYRSPTMTGHARIRMVRYLPFDEKLAEEMRANRGVWWAVGNEPNDPNQDYRTPKEYARLYHDFYYWAKRTDRSCKIIPAGIADADWRWATAFRERYRELYGGYPLADGWNIHYYLLGDDPYDVPEFKRRILAFRHWMMSIGEDEKPLFLTEFGVLYGSGCCQRPVDPQEKTVKFMRETVSWLAATDHVQHWAWFILNNARDFNGGLFDEMGQMTVYGQTYRDLIAEFGSGP